MNGPWWGFVSCAIGAADEDFHSRLGGAGIPRWAFTLCAPGGGRETFLIFIWRSLFVNILSETAGSR